jgi:hypothetical protein
MEPGEQIVVEARRHIISYLPIVAATIIVFIASNFAIGYLTLHQAEIQPFLPFPVASLSGILMLIDLLMIVIAVLAFYIYRENRIVLTNLHFVEFTQTGLFGRRLSKLSLDELQDVTGERRGVLATILNYGVIITETAGAVPEFQFGPVADPISLAEVINDTHEAFERAHTYERP